MIQMILQNSLINSIGQAALNNHFIIVKRIGVAFMLALALFLHGMECLAQKLFLRNN